MRPASGRRDGDAPSDPLDRALAELPRRHPGPGGAFSGALGRGRMELLAPVAPDILALPCPRALDHTPPGDWTLAFRRDAAGRAGGVEVGCWLAPRLS